MCDDCMMAQCLTEEDKGESDKDSEGAEEKDNQCGNEGKVGKIRNEGDLEEAAVLETDTGKQ